MRRSLWQVGVFASAASLLAMVILMRRSYRTPDQFTYTSQNAVYGIEFQWGFVCVARLPPFFTGYRRGFRWITFASPSASSRARPWPGSVDRYSVTLSLGRCWRVVGRGSSPRSPPPAQIPADAGSALRLGPEP